MVVSNETVDVIRQVSLVKVHLGSLTKIKGEWHIYIDARCDEY